MDLFKWMITLSFLAIKVWCISLYTDPGHHDNIRSLLTHLKLDEQRKAYIPHFPYFEKDGLSTQESVNTESIINPEQVPLNNVRQKHYEFNGKGIIQSAYHRYISSESDGFVRKGSIPDIFLVTKLEADKPIVMVVNGHAINIRPQHFDLWYKALTKFTQKKHSSTEEKYRVVNDKNLHLTGMKPSLTESSSSSDSNSRPGQMHRIRDSLKYGDYIRWQENNQGKRNRKHAIAQYILFKKSEGERRQYPTGRESIEYHDTGSLQIRTLRLDAHKPQEDELYSQGHLPLEYHAFVTLKELPEKHLFDPSGDETMRHESYNEYFGTPSDYLPHDYSSLKLPFTKQPRGHPNFHFFSTNQVQKYPNSHFPFLANQHEKYLDHYSPEDQPEEYPDSFYFSENHPEEYPGSVYFSEKQTEEYLSSNRTEDRLQKKQNFFYSSTNQSLVYPSSYYTKNHLPGYLGAFYSPQNQTEEYLGALHSSENPSQERNLYPSNEVPVARKILQPERIPSEYDEHEVDTVPDDHGQSHLENVYEKYEKRKPGNITNEPNDFHYPESKAIVHNISLEHISSYFLSSTVNITEMSVAYDQGEKNLLEGKRLQESNTLTTNEENLKENDVGNQYDSFFRGIPNMEGSGSFALPLKNSSVMQRNFVNLEKFEIVSNSDPEFDQESEVYFEYNGSGDVESNDILKESWLMLSDGPPKNVSRFFGPSNKTATGRLIDVFSSPNDSSTPCTTPKGEPGHCRSIRHCLLHEVLNNYMLFLEHICLLRRTFVGVCCPDNPVISEILESEDDDVLNNSFPLEYNQPLEGCGLNTKTRIVGGSVSRPHEWTWMVALMRRNRFFCGGVIINDWYVLTAAHCTLGINIKEIKIRLGEYNFLDSRTTHEDVEISEIKRHAQFITATFQHDIALLKLRRKIQYSKHVGSICLPQKGKDFTEINATVVGWGTVSFGGSVSPILRQVTVPVWRNADCDGTYVLENINDSFLCAGSPDSEQDACQGDSGGPLMAINKKERWEVIGIVSWGRRCGDPNYPGVYTRVTTYLDWIEDNMQ